MAIHPKEINPLEAEVLAVAGECSAGHKKGDKIVLGCYDSGGLCGFFYHDIFPSLSVLQFGGRYPWSKDESLVLECPDRKNAVTIKVKRT